MIAMPLVHGEEESVCWNCGSPELRQQPFTSGQFTDTCDDCGVDQ